MYLISLRQNVEVIELDRTGIRTLQRGDRSHQGAFACSVRAKQSEHMVADSQREIFESFYAI